MSAKFDKQELMRQVIAHLMREFETLERAANEAHEGATNSEVKQENKYDTRGLEASYLAAGQSRRALEVRGHIEKLKEIPLDPLGPNSVAVAGALVLIEGGQTSTRYFLLPFVGGIVLSTPSGDVKVVSTASPLGQSLMGKSVGEDFIFNQREFSVASID